MNKFKDKVIVITGGTGFIGTNLIISLLQQDVKKVVCIARDADKIIRTDNNLFLDYACTFKLQPISADLETTSLFSVLNNYQIDPDYIFHLAAVSGGIHWLKQNQAKVLNTNISILANSFQNIEQFKNLKGNLYLSSVCAYPQELQEDTKNCTLSDFEAINEIHNPDSSYGWSKIIGEMLVKHYTAEFKVPGVIVRMFNVYGPYEKLDINQTHVIPALIIKAMKYPEVSFEVLGDGTQVRSFLYVDDAIKALKLAILKVKDGDIINVGITEGITIKEITEQIIKISGKNITPIFSSVVVSGVKARLPKIIKASMRLGWTPKTPLEKGLLKTYKWIAENL